MHDVLDVLEEARRRVLRGWASTNADLAAQTAGGHYCASVGMFTASMSLGHSPDVNLKAHEMFLRAAGIEPPTSTDAIFDCVYAFNDAQTSRRPVVIAFDRAIGLSAVAAA